MGNWYDREPHIHHFMWYQRTYQAVYLIRIKQYGVVHFALYMNLFVFLHYMIVIMWVYI